MSRYIDADALGIGKANRDRICADRRCGGGGALQRLD